MRLFYLYNYHPSLHHIQMPDHLLESSRRDDFNKRPNTGPGEEITQIVLNEDFKIENNRKLK